MKLFAVTLMEPSETCAGQLVSALERSLAGLHIDMSAIRIECFWYGTYSQIVGSGVLPEFQLNEQASLIYRSLADCLAEWIVREKESALLETIVSQEFGYEGEEERKQIGGYCRQMLGGEQEPGGSDKINAGRRIGKISGELCQHLECYTDLNVNGFIRFRLQPYMEELREVAEYAIDEYLMEKQYQEFIGLLKYFVYIQEAKIPVAHLIHQGGNDFTLLDDRLEPIDANEFDSTFTVELMEKDINFEDMIVSTLITVAPQQIVIHTREPEIPIIHTIAQIFEDRTKLCHYCKFCRPVLGDTMITSPARQMGEQS